MAMANGLHWTLTATAATGNTGGGGFNILNANFVADLTTDANTANTSAPVASSATYSFVAGDASAWLYVKTGTNWIPGWYLISSVAGGKATLNGTIGSAVIFDSVTGEAKPSTVVGCATVGTPTAGTFGVDYSQQDAARSTATDYASVAATTTLTSVAAGFTRMMVGNMFHQTTSGTGGFGTIGWYEIVVFTNTTTVTLDRSPNSGVNSVACTGFCGGAGRLNGLEDSFGEQLTADSRVWIKNGSYTTSAAFSISSTLGTAALPISYVGYNSVRGDTCNGANRPVITAGANTFSFGQYNNCFNVSFVATTTTGIANGVGSIFRNCKFLNTSTTAARVALGLTATDGRAYDCEAVSQNGTAIGTVQTASKVVGCYVHDSVTGISMTARQGMAVSNIIEACTTDGINVNIATGGMLIHGNTVYGREAKIGTGINFNNATSINNDLANNIFYGLTTGVTVLTTNQKSNQSLNNDYFNNTTDVTNLTKSSSDLALDPQFTGATQITGTTATTSGSVLTQSGGAFGPVTDTSDYLHVTSGTGVTVGCYQITAHTATTLTVNNALGTSSGGDVVYWVTTGHTFAIGTNLKAKGFSSLIANSESTTYVDVGAVQRQEAASGGTGGGSFAYVS